MKIIKIYAAKNKISYNKIWDSNFTIETKKMAAKIYIEKGYGEPLLPLQVGFIKVQIDKALLIFIKICE